MKRKWKWRATVARVPVNLFLLNTQFTKGNLKIRISALSKKYGYECRFIFYKCYLLCYTKCAYWGTFIALPRCWKAIFSYSFAILKIWTESFLVRLALKQKPRKAKLSLSIISYKSRLIPINKSPSCQISVSQKHLSQRGMVKLKSNYRKTWTNCRKKFRKL